MVGAPISVGFSCTACVIELVPTYLYLKMFESRLNGFVLFYFWIDVSNNRKETRNVW